MSDLQRIHARIAQVRSRLRLQSALEWAITATVPAIGAALIVFFLWRMHYVTGSQAVIGAIASGGIVLLGALWGALRPYTVAELAARLDKSAGLADRLGTAIDFSERLRKDRAKEHPDTVQLMEAAIADGVRAVDRANPKAASPFRQPRDLMPAGIFAVVAMLVVLLAFGPPKKFPPLGLRPSTAMGLNDPDSITLPVGLDTDDTVYQKQFVEDMRQMAEQTKDPHLKDFTEALEKLLELAEKGEITKAELMARMEQLEKQYMEGAEQDVDSMMDSLKESAAELKKEQLTKKLGEALEAGDMETAEKELEKLADQLDKNELTPEQQKKLAEAFEKAAKKHDEKQAKEQQDLQKQIDKKREEIRKLEKKVAENPKNEEQKRKLEREKKDLEKLERNKQEKQEQAQKRQLERLNRNMKKSAESLRNKNQKEAAQKMRETAQDTRKVQDEMRKIQNQQKVQSQLTDLKDAIRRAKPNKGKQGQAGMRSQRIKEWERRAGGQPGDSQQWKPGQGKPGQGKNGQGNDPNGPPGKQYGDQHDPNLMGDPTKLSGNKHGEDLTGLKGPGPSKKHTILTAAQKGFASQGYKQVYAEYKKIVEEVMSAEKVPQGYKYYVKRYFQRIKPHQMD
jgi:hypothetical protein